MTTRLNVALAATTLVLAGLTVHYARAVTTLRAQNDQAMASATSSPDIQVSPAAQHASAVMMNTGSTSSTDDGSKPANDPRFDPVTMALARYRLEELRDPRGRAQRMRELVDLYYGGMATVVPHIGMSLDELQRYAETRAEQTLRSLQRQQECQIDPGCDIKAMRAARQAEAKKEDALALGPQLAARLEDFQAAFSERNFVHELQQALPAANALTNVQAGKLALALSEENEKFDAETQQYGKRTRRYSGPNAMEVRSAAYPDATDEFLQRRDSATRHQQMLYDRAASLLTAAQLTKFKSMQDDAIAQYIELLREDEIAANAREAARK